MKKTDKIIVISRIHFAWILTPFSIFWHYVVIFLPIFIPGQFMTSFHSNFLDWTLGLGGDRSRHAYTTVTQPMVKILVRFGTLHTYLMLIIYKVDNFTVLSRQMYSAQNRVKTIIQCSVDNFTVLKIEWRQLYSDQ